MDIEMDEIEIWNECIKIVDNKVENILTEQGINTKEESIKSDIDNFKAEIYEKIFNQYAEIKEFIKEYKSNPEECKNRIEELIFANLEKLKGIIFIKNRKIEFTYKNKEGKNFTDQDWLEQGKFIINQVVRNPKSKTILKVKEITPIKSGFIYSFPKDTIKDQPHKVLKNPDDLEKIHSKYLKTFYTPYKIAKLLNISETSVMKYAKKIAKEEKFPVIVKFDKKMKEIISEGIAKYIKSKCIEFSCSTSPPSFDETIKEIKKFIERGKQIIEKIKNKQIEDKPLAYFIGLKGKAFIAWGIFKEFYEKYKYEDEWRKFLTKQMRKHKSWVSRKLKKFPSLPEENEIFTQHLWRNLFRKLPPSKENWKKIQWYNKNLPKLDFYYEKVQDMMNEQMRRKKILEDPQLSEEEKKRILSDIVKTKYEISRYYRKFNNLFSELSEFLRINT